MLPRKFCTISITAVVFLCLLWSFGFVIASTNVQSGVWKGIPVEFRKGEALLVTEDEEIWTDLTTLRTTLSVTTPDSTTGGGYFMIQFPETSNVLNICTQFESANGVIACIPSLRMRKASNDAHFEYQWNMYNDGSLYAETEGHDIMLDEAHAISRGNSDVKLVIIDSGVPWDFDLDQPTHLDLNNDNFPEHITRATEFPEGFINPSDVEGHGTQVAGIALGEADNNYGIAGVCPECNGVVYKVWNSDESDNFLAPTMMGMWRAANLEGEGDDYDDPTVILVPSTLFTQGIEGDLDALRALENLLKDLVYRNHNNQWPDYSTRNLFIFPTGNENLHYVPYPARFASYDRIESGVISVGATNIFDNRWWVNDGIGSNYWGSNVTLSAPGGGATEPGCEPGILSSDIVSSRQHSCYWGLLQGPHSDFLSNKGTSIAAAHVAGLAGLVWSLSPNLTNWQVKNYMVAGVDAIADEMGEGREVGAGRINAFKTLLRVPVEKRLQRDLTIRKSPYQGDSPYQLDRGDLVVPPLVTLTIEAGVSINLHLSAIRVEPGGRLVILGEEGNEVVLRGYYQDQIHEGESGWTGIIADDASLSISHCVIERAENGIVLGGSSNLRMDNSRIVSSYTNGLRVLSGSRATLTDCDVLFSAGSGIDARNAALVSLERCEISHNNTQGQLFSGGIFAFFTNQLMIECCEITDNVGAGIYGWWSNIRLTPTSGNPTIGGPGYSDFSGNSYINGQCLFRSCSVQMEGGRNRFGAPPAAPEGWYYLEFADHPAVIEPVNLNGNHWSITEPGEENWILDHILATSLDIVQDGFDYETSWDLCDNSTMPTLSVCDSVWDTAIFKLAQDSFETASVQFKNVLTSGDQCVLKPLSPRVIVSSEKSAGTTYGDIVDYLTAREDTTTDYALKFSLAQASAEAKGYDGEFTEAISELDSLATDSYTSISDSVSCLTSIASLEFLQAMRTLTSAESVMMAVDTLQSALDNLTSFLVGDEVFAPTLELTPPGPLPRAATTLDLSSNIFCDDSIGIAEVFIDYKYVLTGAWDRDTLVLQGNDTTWEISLPTDTLGGGIEFRLWVVDSAYRVATWPMIGSIPNLNDTLTHFVSFEPRLTAPLTDTAYVYAPGVITDDIEIGDGGVLYVLPAPVALDSYVVAIDSGVGITLVGEESEAELIVNGTDSTVIRLECADAGDRWAGISDLGGVVQIDHAELRETVRPLYSAKDVGWPYIRLQDVTISDFALPSFLGSANSGLDTSYVIDCTFEDGDSTGIVIAEGSASLDFEDVTIQNCGDDGLVLSEADDLLLTNVRITENGRYGIFTETGTGNSVRLSNCYIAFNGDTLPEIKANSYSSIDVSDYAGNIVKDSTGVLFECAEVNDFDAELGSNSFVLADSTGKYFNVTSMSGPSYITGNTFYPESVNDSTFIDDYMKHDTLSKWVYSYLRADNLMDEVIEDPNGSIDFELKAYVQNYLGTVANDTITQVGFKYRVFPDSTHWTTLRQNTIETDSIYDWTVSVGDQGGLISYIWWAKDAHGRFLTSPAGADTTTPDSGATHFLSFEMSDTLISGGDSVTIWAPTTLTHDLRVGDFGKLVIKPWPGASDHTITLSEGVSLYAVSQNAGLGSARLWIQGTESMPITLEAVNDTSEWEQFYIYKGNLVATYTTFRSNLVAMESGPLGTNILKLDHCTFESSQGYYYVTGTDVADSYIRNCVFRDLGMCWDMGPFLVYEGDIEITDSWFYNNRGPGMMLADAGATEISGCNVIANDQSGLLSYGLVSSMSISCSEFSYNGGDTVPEVYMWDGTFDFSDDAGNVFADKGGTLLEGPTMASFELDSGGNGFYLFDSTGHYIVTGDNTDTLDASGNLWFPFTPDTSIFQDYFDPDTSRYWDWASPTASLAECGVGGISSMPGDGPMALIRPTASTYNVPNHGGSASKSANASKSVSKSFDVKRVSSVAYDEAVVAQKNRQYADAKSKFASFITQNPEHPKTEAALSRFMVSAKKSGQTEGLADFFAREEATSTNPRVKRAAKFLKLNALVMDGRSQEALDAYDDIIRKPETRHDSITAVIGATRVLYNNRTSRMSTPHPENMPESFTDMCRRVMRLIASERRTNPVLDENPVAPVIPTSYALYQNYPNPFNPSTDIRFDLPEAIRVELKIFNILGQEVVTLVDDVRAAGAYRVLWDGKNAAGLNTASGVYVYQIKTPNFQDAKKMVMIK